MRMRWPVKCETARRDLSASMEGSPVPARTTGHLEACEDCRRFLLQLEQLRAKSVVLAAEPLRAPDVVDRVMARLPARRPAARRWSVATGFALGAVVGAVLAGGVGGPRTSVAVELPDAVVAAQSAVHRLTASFTVTESIAPDVLRTYRGELAYRSPEFLAIEVTQTSGPVEWPLNSWSLSIDRETAVVASAFPCPTLGGCPDGEPRTRTTTGRDPFSVIVPAPLDAVVPSSVLRNGVEPERFDGGDLLGRPTVAFVVSAAQADSLLDAYFDIGNWREIHPTDLVAIWLDRDSFIPLRVAVSPIQSIDRMLWAARRGYEDDLGAPYLVVEYVEVDLTSEVIASVEPGDGPAIDAGFRADMNLVPPVDPGFPLVAAGTLSGRVPTTVWAWSDGRAWIRLDLAQEWADRGLFGNDGSAVRALEQPEGPIFGSGGGDRVFVHGEGFDAVITGSLESAALEDLANALPGVRLAIPADWPEAPAASAQVERAWLPSGLTEYSEPILRASDGIVQVDLFAAGGRSVRIVSQPAGMLSPPLDPDARAIPVRETTGRYSPMLGLLEWTEGETSVSIGSATASLDELLAIAASLTSPDSSGP
jgi:hypothetical protein